MELCNQSVEYIEKAYGERKVSYKEALSALGMKDLSIRANRDNQAEGFYKYTPYARCKLTAISWATTRILAVEKKRI